MAKSKKIIKDQSTLGQFGSAIAQICEEKGIDKERVVESIEAALAAAYKKDYGKKGQIIIAKMDEKVGDATFKQLKEVVDESSRTIEEDYASEEIHEIPKNAAKSKEVVDRAAVGETESEALPKFNPERDVFLKDAKKIDKTLETGDFLEIPLETKDQYGRVASQTAKQVIIQRIREAERDSMYDEYKGKEGEVINGTVQRIEMDKVFVDLGKAVGVIFPSEQISGESYRVNQRVRIYIEKVESDPKGPGITLSRRHPNLLLKLFELEVPEVFSGSVEIKAIAREAGSRSKIAVISNEEGIDPIGSCVGQKGTRVQAVIDEVNGEKIDIIEWNDDVEKLIAAALAPAKVIKVDIDEERKEAEAFVEQDQLSLAIGKKGQNVRLAAKLTGWKIDVKMIEGGDEKVKDEGDEKDEKKNDSKKTDRKIKKENKSEDKKDTDAEEKSVEESSTMPKASNSAKASKDGEDPTSSRILGTSKGSLSVAPTSTSETDKEKGSKKEKKPRKAGSRSAGKKKVKKAKDEEVENRSEDKKKGE